MSDLRNPILSAGPMGSVPSRCNNFCTSAGWLRLPHGMWWLNTSCAIFLQTPLVRLFVDAINRRRVLAHQPRRHRLVRQQHAFLDQLVRHVVLGLLDAQNVPAFVQPDFGFGKIEVERAGLEPQPPDALGEFMRLMQHLLNRIGRGLALQESPALRRR